MATPSERVTRLERAVAVQAHVGVLLVRYGSDDVAALIERAPNAGLIVLPRDEADVYKWEAAAVASAAAFRMKHPLPCKPAPIVATVEAGHECKPSSGEARAMITKISGNSRSNIRYFTTHEAALAACDAMNATATDGSRFEVCGLAAPRRLDRHNRRA